MVKKFEFFKAIDIMDHQGKGVYLRRWMLFKSPWVSIYLHQFHQSDSGLPHDHPWNFITWILTEGYTEHQTVPTGLEGKLKTKSVKRRPLSIAYRKATDIHQVEIPKGKKPITLCILFKRERVWGFIKKTKSGFVWTNWMSYLGITPDDPRYAGSE